MGEAKRRAERLAAPRELEGRQSIGRYISGDHLYQQEDGETVVGGFVHETRILIGIFEIRPGELALEDVAAEARPKDLSIKAAMWLMDKLPYQQRIQNCVMQFVPPAPSFVEIRDCILGQKRPPRLDAIYRGDKAGNLVRTLIRD
jgi:hypothetical protein